MITFNILERTFLIKTENEKGETEYGTCFTIDVDNRQYIITAKHLVSWLGETGILNVIKNKGQLQPLPVKLVGHGRGEIDISVMAPLFQSSVTFPLSIGVEGMYIGQDVYFLGFPYNMSNQFVEINNSRKYPIVKKAIISMANEENDSILLDGYNNPGFSGGPVFSILRNKKNSKEDFTSKDLLIRIIGVVSGFRYEKKPVYKNGKRTGYYYEDNSGFVRAFCIKHAQDMIAKNPIGFELGKNE